jgi:hypothetical protein
LKPAGPVIRLDKPVGPFAISPDEKRLAVMRVGKTVTSNPQYIDVKTGRKLPPRQIPRLDDLRIYDL